MEKTYYVATLLFGCFITIALGCFSIVCFKMNYLWQGFIFLIVFAGSISMNVVFAKKWFSKTKNV